MSNKNVLFSDNDSSDSEKASGNDNASASGGGFKINEEFAKKFEHNQRRKEIEKLEDKHGGKTAMLENKERVDEPREGASSYDSESDSSSNPSL